MDDEMNARLRRINSRFGMAMFYAYTDTHPGIMREEEPSPTKEDAEALRSWLGTPQRPKDEDTN